LSTAVKILDLFTTNIKTAAGGKDDRNV
jgi:hypothetical protein